MAYTNIDDPSAHFQILLHGSSSNTAASYTFDGNSTMQPDLVWHKNRTVTDEHYLFDSTRGVQKAVYSNLVNAEATHNSSLTSFDSNGYSVGSSNVTSGAGTYVSWNWKANGGTTSSNTSGTITTTVQANTDAGFSIVTWTGSGSNATMGHGLGTTPQVIITKSRTTTNDWNVYHRNMHPTAPYNYLLYTHLTNAATAATGSWGTSLSDVNSSTFYMKYWINYSSASMLAYCFAEKQGFSKFSKYIGNGATNGTFSHTGFKPAFLIIKDITGGAGGTGNWIMWDSKRSPYNPNLTSINANLDGGEFDATAYSNIDIDVLSNGFKIRHDSGKSYLNMSGRTYIFMAFAENPFVTSTGIPTTAR